MSEKEEYGLKHVFCVLLVCLTSIEAQRRSCFNLRTNVCNKDQFMCLNGKCIPRGYYCDNGNDCGDNSDEEFCGRNSVACPAAFSRCNSSTKCIPNEWLCDGRNDCPSGEDETNCGRRGAIDMTKKKGALDWVYNRTFNEYTEIKWDTFVPKAAVAIFLSQSLTNSSYFQFHKALRLHDMAKDVSIQFLSRLSQKKLRDVPSTDLAAFVNAMLVTCIDPRKFHGMNLIEELRVRVNNQNYTNPYVLLTLCNAGETITEDDKTKLEETFLNKRRVFWTDMQAMVVMALSCAAKQPGNSVNEGILKEFTTELKNHQYRNGSVENVQTTALVMQALYAAEPEEDPDNFDETKALQQMLACQKQDGSFGNFMETYYILPVLNCKSLVNITTDHCEYSKRDENSALQDLVNRNVPKIRVVYSLWFDNQVYMERTMALKVPANMSFYGIMEIAGEIDDRYGFRYLVKNRKPYVNGISDLLDDPETGKFWFLHIIEDGEPVPISKSPADIMPKNNDHYVFWYRSGSWTD